MAIGKNKRMAKKGKKKQVDPFQRKDWYTVRAPSMFAERNAGKTLITKTTGQKIASEEMKGRVFEVSLADLNKNEDDSYRKIKLRAEEVEGFKVLTTFHGMDLTRDKLCSLIKKWQSLIEARVDIKTTDGYSIRMFAIGFTKRRNNQIRKTSYAQNTQVKAIRKKMVDVMIAEAKGCDLKKLVLKFIPEIIGKKIEKACEGVYPIQNCYIRKVKVLGIPKFDITKLLELHDDKDEVGAKVDRANIESNTTIQPSAEFGGRL